MVFFQPSVISWHLITSLSLLPSYWLHCLLLIEAWLFFQNYNKEHKLGKMEKVSLLLFLSPWLSGLLQSNSPSLLVYFKYHKQICPAVKDIQETPHDLTLFRMSEDTNFIMKLYCYEVRTLHATEKYSLGASHQHDVKQEKPDTKDEY